MEVATMCKLAQLMVEPTGEYTFLALGQRRVRIIEWLEDDPYPQAVVIDADYVRIPPTELSAGSVFQPRTPPNCLRVKSTILANASELQLGYFPGPSVELFVKSPILANSIDVRRLG